MSKMSGRLYTVGYATWTLEQLTRQIGELGAMLLDIRYSPNSRQPQWRKRNLVAHLGDAYVHVQSLGNVNDKGGEMQMHD